MPALTHRIIKPKLLIGEGAEEVRFFGALLAHLHIGDVQVEDYKGKQGLSSYLKTLTTVRPGRERLVSLGITRDADDNARDAFRSVCGALERIGLPLPASPMDFVGEALRVGVLILPDGHSEGMLEDLCLSAIGTYPEMRCVDEYFRCVNDAAKRQPRNMAKARVHAWLSSQTEPDKLLGVAAEIGYWPWNSPAFAHVKQFLRQL